MTMLNQNWTLGPSTEDLAIGRLIGALRRRARRPKNGAQRPAAGGAADPLRRSGRRVARDGPYLLG